MSDSVVTERTVGKWSRQRRAGYVAIAFVLYSTIFFDRWEYSKSFRAYPDAFMDVARGTAAAPQQYRIGVVWAADMLRRHGHLALRHGFGLIDALSAAVAVCLLFSLLMRTPAYRAAGELARWFGVAAFLFLIQYYFVWIAWYQRPETLPSLCVLVLTLWLLSVRLPLPRNASIMVTSILMLGLSAIQAFIRPDVIIAVHMAVLLLCLTRMGEGFSVPRIRQAITSVIAVMIAGGIQYYLMHVVYPLASYGATPVFELVLNLTRPVRWASFVPFIWPWVWLVTVLVRRRWFAEAPGLALVVGSAIYIGMWMLVGGIDEVRIFLPYAVALAPLTCACAMHQLGPERESHVPINLP